MAWLKAHVPQILVIVFSVVVGVLLHFGKLTPDSALALGAILAGFGIHLPPIVYKVPPVVGSMLAALGLFLVGVFGLSVVMLACTAQTVAKDEYSAQKHACVDTSTSRDELFACWQSVDDKWNEAGAKPSAVLDGGAQ